MNREYLREITNTSVLSSPKVFFFQKQQLEKPGVISQIQTYLSTTPSQPIRSFIRNQLAETQHQAVDKRQKEVDGGAAEEAPDGRRFVEDQGRGT